jgi:hypothetical protein
MFLRYSVDFQRTTWRYTPEDSTLHNHHSENLNFYIIQQTFTENCLKYLNACFGNDYDDDDDVCIKFSKRQVSISKHSPLLASCWLIGLLFDSEDGGSKFLRNGSKLLLHYMSSHPKK